MNPLLLLLLTCRVADSLPPTCEAIVTVQVSEFVVYTRIDTVISISITVKPGYHIQANKVNDESLIPTTVEVKSVQGITIGNPQFPPCKKFKLDGTDSFLDVYDGTFPIKLDLSQGADTRPGNYVLNATLRYQACDSKSCLFPRKVDFSIPIEVKTKESK